MKQKSLGGLIVLFIRVIRFVIALPFYIVGYFFVYFGKFFCDLKTAK